VTSGQVSIERSPDLDLDEVVALYPAVGRMVYANDPRTLAAALAGSACIVTARHHGRLVGLARAISDGATICYVQDVLVHREREDVASGAG
jgi:hypothetical protein